MRDGHSPDGLKRHSAFTSAPRIETERLVLRAFTADDLDAHAAMLGDADVMRFVGGTALPREEAWRRLMATVGMWQLIGIGTWAVELKSDGRMVGNIGFLDVERDMVPSIKGEPEMGWMFSTAAHGQGIAHEACEAALEWADANLGGASYPAIIDAENVASIRLAERLGFQRVGDAVYKDQTISLYRRPFGG